MWRLGAAAGGFSTAIDFGDAGDVDLAETSVSLTASRQLGPRWGLQLMGGAIVDGSVGDGDVQPGVSAAVAASYLWVYETEHRPFVLASASLGASTSKGRADDGSEQRLTAVDVRAGLAAGKTFFGRLSLYALARAFGGPVFWTVAGDGVVGGDTHHYTFGAGAVWRPGARLEISAEGAPLGERSFAFAASMSF